MRYTKSIFKKSRYLGFSLLENNKEFSKGKARTTRPGQHGAKKAKHSNYGQQLIEKQKLMYLYGLNDRQFRRLFLIAKKRPGTTTLNLLQVLESRLDSLVFKAGFAPTRRSARQLVSHGHILVNNQRVDIPSYLVSVNDKISVNEKSLSMKLISENKKETPAFLQKDKSKQEVILIRLPERDELPSDIHESSVVEWFNKLL